MSKRTDIAAEVLGLILGTVMLVGFIGVVVGGVVAASLYVLRALHGG